jgi:uncharacterized membrane protein YciS (DUF1049 family)
MNDDKNAPSTPSAGGGMVLDRLEHQDRRIEGLEIKIDKLFNKLTEFNNSLTLFSAKPQFDIAKLLDIATKLGFLMSLIVGGIVWVTSAHFSSQLSLQQERLDTLKERVINLETNIKNRNGGTTP